MDERVGAGACPLEGARGTDPARHRSKALRDQADIALLRGDVLDPDEGW